jgi:hypothetical protein
MRSWGARAEEIAASYPGDELVPDTIFRTNRAISINAAPEAIWPWLVQMGMGRGGWYAYDRLLKFIGSAEDTTSATTVLPEFQELKVGDPIDLLDRIIFRVADVQPNRALVMYCDGRNQPSQPFNKAWSFVLIPDGPSRTRLLIRESMSWIGPGTWFLMWLTNWIQFACNRKTLKNLKRLVEQSAPAAP